MPTFVAMSSRNKWVAISTNGLLSGNRDSEAISAVPLEACPAEDEGVYAFVVPQERPDVVLVDVHLRDVLRRNLRLPAPAPGREQEAGEGVPGDGDVFRDFFPEPLVEDAEVAHGDVVDVLVVFVRHGLVRGTHPTDRVPGPEDRGGVAALSHRVQGADLVAVEVRDRRVRERSYLALDAERRAGFSHRHVEGRPPEVRLLPHPAREVVPHALPKLNDPIGARLLDHVLD